MLDRVLRRFRRAAGSRSTGWVVAGDLVLGVAWVGAAQLLLAMPPVVGLAWVTVVCSLFLRRYSVGSALRSGRRCVPTGDRCGGASGTTVLAAALTFACLGQLWHVVYQRVPRIARPPTEIWDAYAATPMGLLAVSMFIVAVAPVMEEFCYRGWIMPALRQRYGPSAAILGSSLLFALLHGWISWLPYYLLAGIVLALAVHLSGSVWTGVFMHATYNATCVIVDAASPTPDALAVWLDASPFGASAAPLGMSMTAAILIVLGRRVASDARHRLS